MILMVNPGEIFDYLEYFNKTIWIDESEKYKAFGKILCKEYGCLKAMNDAVVDALVIFQNQIAQDEAGNQVVNCFIVQVIPIAGITIIKEYMDVFNKIIKEWGIYELQTVSALKRTEAIEKLFGMKYQYSFFTRRV
jgi:hypothetical protein